jgi:hypothetical protein
MSISNTISEKENNLSIDCQQTKKEVKLKHEMVTRGFACFYFFRFAYNLRGCGRPG